MARKLPRGKPPSERGNRLQREQPILRDDDDPVFIATHEAGHAVAAVVVGMDLTSVDIKRRPHLGGVSLGFTKVNLHEKLREIAGKGEEAAMPLLIHCLAGPSAEMRVNATCDGDGFKLDRQEAWRIAAIAICSPVYADDGHSATISTVDQQQNADRISALISSGSEAAARLTGERWDAITAVAAALIRHRSLTGEQVAEIVARLTPAPGHTL